MLLTRTHSRPWPGGLMLLTPTHSGHRQEA